MNLKSWTTSQESLEVMTEMPWNIIDKGMINREDLRTRLYKKAPVSSPLYAFKYKNNDTYAPAEDYQTLSTQVREPSSCLLCLSGESSQELRELAKDYASRLQNDPDFSLQELAGIAHQETKSKADQGQYRVFLLVESRKKLQKLLTQLANGKEKKGLIRQVQSEKTPSTTFLFSGEGSQYLEMAQALFQTQPIFRKYLERCDHILRGYLQVPLLDLLCPEKQGFSFLTPEEREELLNQTKYAQPALFAFEYSLAKMWMSLGIVPGKLIGHGVGEYVAACLAEVFSLEDGLKLIVNRAGLLQGLPKNNGMMKIGASEQDVEALITSLEDDSFINDLSIAEVNSSKEVVISGSQASLKKMSVLTQKQKIQSQLLNRSYALNSVFVEPILEAFEAVAGEIEYQTPQIPVVSGLTGENIEGYELTQACYWRIQTRLSIQFAKGVETLKKEDGENFFLEIGPASNLLDLVKESYQEETSQVSGIFGGVSSLKKNQEERQMMRVLGEFHAIGVNVNWFLPSNKA